MPLVKWDEPKVDADVSKVEIYRASSKTGTYSLVATIDAKDGSGNWVKEYNDTSGSSTDWYKIRFLNSALTAGDYSEPRQVGYRPFVTIDDFRELTNYNEGEISDRDFERIRPEAERAVLDRISVRVKFEELSGTIDGTNKEFTTHHKPIADADLSQVYDSADVEVYEGTTTSEGNLDYGSTVSVSSVEQLNGIINLTTAPTTGVDKLYCNYSYYKKIYETDTLREAALYYAAYLLARRNNLEDPEQWLDLFERTLSR